MIAPPPVVEGPLGKFPALFTRLTGRNGLVREYRALLVSTATCSVIPKVDAYQLGYPEAATSGTRLNLPNALTFATFSGYERGAAVKMAKVDIGSISFREVEFVPFDIQQSVGFDVVLGQNLLREMRLELDFVSSRLRLEKVAGPQ